MDSVREEVRRKLAWFERDWMGGDNLSIVFCGVIESHLELEQDPDSDTGWHEDVKAECDTTLDALTDAIMSAFKRAPGVESAPEHVGPDAMQLLHDVGQFLNSAAVHVGAAGCRDIADRMDKYVEQIGELVRDEAKRAAVEPSCVVTDEMVIRLMREGARVCAEAEGDDYVDPLEEFSKPHYGEDGVRDQIDTWKRILTAALSSRTEEEVRAEVTEEIAAEMSELSTKAEALAEAGTQKRKNDWTAYIFRQHAFVLRSRLRARSLTNRGE